MARSVDVNDQGRAPAPDDTAAPHGIMFHYFHDPMHPPCQGSFAADDLAVIIQRLGSHRFIDPAEWVQRAATDELRKGDLCLTLDDGLRCQFDVALPVMRRFGLRAFWFVYTSVFEGEVERLELYRWFRATKFTDVESFYESFDERLDASPFGADARRALGDFDPRNYLVEYPFYTDGDRRFRFLRDDVLGPERYHTIMAGMLDAAGVDAADFAGRFWMDRDCLVQLQEDGHVIGMHSHTHPTRLSDLSPGEQRQEYEANHAWIKDLTGRAPTSVSHPCNSYSASTLSILRDMGIDVGFRATMSGGGGSSLECAREDSANMLRAVS